MPLAAPPPRSITLAARLGLVPTDDPDATRLACSTLSERGQGGLSRHDLIAIASDP